MFEDGIKREIENYQPFTRMDKTEEEEFEEYYKGNITLEGEYCNPNSNGKRVEDFYLADAEEQKNLLQK